MTRLPSVALREGWVPVATKPLPDEGGQATSPHSAIFLGDFKAIRFFETGETKLFNLTKDLGEKTNLAKKMPEKAAEMEKLLIAYLKETKAQIPTPNPKAIEGKIYSGKGGGKGKEKRRSR